jgi:thiamine phosphate synthase YjbQ (UPF0047 family)
MSCQSRYACYMPPMQYSIIRLLVLFIATLPQVSVSFVSSRAVGRKHTGNAVTCTPICDYHQIDIPTSLSGPPRQAVSVEDLTPMLHDLIKNAGLQSGTVTVISRHTTTAITINERESRLARDMADLFLRLAPPDERSESVSAHPGTRYQHNDIDQRPESAEEAKRCRENGWDIDDPSILKDWRDQEPINAHSHLISMLLGSSECIPVVDGKMVIGQWQSVLMVDLDGPRDRTVGVHLMGYKV